MPKTAGAQAASAIALVYRTQAANAEAICITSSSSSGLPLSPSLPQEGAHLPPHTRPELAQYLKTPPSIATKRNRPRPTETDRDGPRPSATVRDRPRPTTYKTRVSRDQPRPTACLRSSGHTLSLRQKPIAGDCRHHRGGDLRRCWCGGFRWHCRFPHLRRYQSSNCGCSCTCIVSCCSSAGTAVPQQWMVSFLSKKELDFS